VDRSNRRRILDQQNDDADDDTRRQEDSYHNLDFYWGHVDMLGPRPRRATVCDSYSVKLFGVLKMLNADQIEGMAPGKADDVRNATRSALW
jgi:hypothetical protein